ncbi:hypothetical protein ElyMa_002642900 [Elysia marginata]|uniref:Uncharacterized protein n=1 Tax=Elysia marginata TaxID=1093978 RepID=A0AAV4HA11_9GAST|nr:hypothetical protein ElyMa_002642900 [Elysia marginata]
MTSIINMIDNNSNVTITANIIYNNSNVTNITDIVDNNSKVTNITDIVNNNIDMTNITDREHRQKQPSQICCDCKSSSLDQPKHPQQFFFNFTSSSLTAFFYNYLVRCIRRRSIIARAGCHVNPPGRDLAPNNKRSSRLSTRPVDLSPWALFSRCSAVTHCESHGTIGPPPRDPRAWRAVYNRSTKPHWTVNGGQHLVH